MTWREPLEARRAVQRLCAARFVFRRRGERTYLAVSDAGAPLKVLRPFQLEDGRALLQVISASPGFLGGDRHEIEIAAEAGARAVVITPSAAKIHSMTPGSFASQSIRLRVEAGASLEYYPALAIPFPDADFLQELSAEVEAGGRLGMTETWAAGRVRRGEHLRFRRLSSRIRVDVNAEPLYRDGVELNSGSDGWGLLEGHRYVTSGVWCGVKMQPPDLPRGLERCAVCGPLAAAAFYYRGLFHDSVELEQVLAKVRGAVAHAWGHSEFSALRYSC